MQGVADRGTRGEALDRSRDGHDDRRRGRARARGMEARGRECGSSRRDRGLQREARPAVEQQVTKVRIREVGPRDGIQSERAQIATTDKIRLIDALSRTGLSYIEAVSFVSPKAVPQMADAKDVWAGFDRRPGITYSAL